MATDGGTEARRYVCLATTITDDEAIYRVQWGLTPDPLDMKSTMLFRKEDGQWVIYSVDDTK